MDFQDIIIKKRDKQKLTKEEISFFIQGVTDGSLPDYQISALLMAILLNGMDAEETAQMTMESGQTQHRRCWRHHHADSGTTGSFSWCTCGKNERSWSGLLRRHH